MDRILDFDEMSRDSALLVRLEALAKLTLGMLNILESSSSASGQDEALYIGVGEPSYLNPARWGDLDALGLQAQRDAWRYYDRFNSLGSFVMGADVPSRKARFESLGADVNLVLLQDNTQPVGVGADMKHFKEARDALPQQFELLKQAAKSALGIPIFVPDTNILMDIAERAEEGTAQAIAWERLKASHRQVRVIIVPPVVKELDELKRSRDNRRKSLARAAIAALWESRVHVRGPRGLEVARGVFVDFLATEPTAEDFAFLPWLDPGRPDHRVIASVLDVARRHLRDQVALVTGDLNMSILAGYAALRSLKLGEAMPDDDPEGPSDDSLD